MSIVLHFVGKDKILLAEWDQLTMWQREVLACVRHFGSCKQAADALGRDEAAVRMIIYRISEKGIGV